eukprot:15434885-Alexandrium_andersonii.AAC.1
MKSGAPEIQCAIRFAAANCQRAQFRRLQTTSTNQEASRSNQQPTANHQQPTTSSQQPTADSQHPTANSR